MLEAKHDGVDDDYFFISPEIDGITVQPIRFGNTRIAPGVMMGSTTRYLNQDIAARFSMVVRQGRLNELISVSSIVRPSIKGLQLLHDAGTTVLYAELDDGKLRPVPMLGDGLQTVLSMALLMMVTQDGVVMLDEFDSTIHHSILPKVWEQIAILANRYNCQVFAVTHSIECVKSAFSGVSSAKKQNDFQYIRLEKNSSGNSAVCYTSSELEAAISAEWEIR